MVTKYNINDIIAYNKQGTFSVGIIVRITIVSSEQACLYMLDNTVEILEDNIVSYLGNAETIKDIYEEE